MSLDVMTAVWKHSEAKGSPLLCLLAMADNADDDGFCFPSYPHLAAKTRMSERQVRRLVTDLLDTDELSLIARGTQGRSNEYSLNVAALRAKPAQMGSKAARPPGQDVNPQPDIEVDTTRPPQPSAFQPSETTPVADATDDGQLFASPAAVPDREINPRVTKVWQHYVKTFSPGRPDLTPSREKLILKGLKEVGDNAEGADYLCKAISGLKIWRRQKPGDESLSAIFATRPNGSALGDQIDFFAKQGENPGSPSRPAVPSVLRGTITQRQREVIDMLAYPESPDHQERGQAAVDWLKAEAQLEPIIEAGALKGWRSVEQAA